jgi:hypothetical protein
MSYQPVNLCHHCNNASLYTFSLNLRARKVFVNIKIILKFVKDYITGENHKIESVYNFKARFTLIVEDLLIDLTYKAIDL